MALDPVSEMETIVAALDREGIEYALCGGLALGVLGHVRATLDIDLLIRAERVADALRVVRTLGFDIPARKIVFGLKLGKRRELQRVSKLDPDTNKLLTLDLLIVNDELEPVWNTRIVLSLDDNPLVSLTVVSREGLATMKRMAGRPRDLQDLVLLEGRSEGDDGVEE